MNIATEARIEEHTRAIMYHLDKLHDFESWPKSDEWYAVLEAKRHLQFALDRLCSQRD